MSVYLFIDARYFRKVLEQRLETFTGTKATIDWTAVRNELGAGRAFYFDSVDDVPRAAETPDQYNGRVRQQEDEVDAIAALDGYFTRLGSVRGDAKRRRQKEVDVLLAVDLLTHSHRRNMQRAVLIAGDMDFKPVVEAVVEQGTLMTVVNDPDSASMQLGRSADTYRPLTLRLMWNVTYESRGPRAAELFPQANRNRPMVPTAQPVEVRVRGVRAFLYREPSLTVLDLATAGDFYPDTYWSFPDEAKLLQFARDEYGSLEFA